MLLKFPKFAEGEILPSSFYVGSITLIPKPNRHITRKLQINIPMNSDVKILNTKC